MQSPPTVHGPRRPRSVGDCLADPAHAGALDGASRVGEATQDGRVVRIGVWSGPGETRARFCATSCASLIAYAEVACEAIEAGAPVDAGALRAALRGVHPEHQERAELVAAAARAALSEDDP